MAHSTETRQTSRDKGAKARSPRSLRKELAAPFAILRRTSVFCSDAATRTASRPIVRWLGRIRAGLRVHSAYLIRNVTS